MKDSGIYIGSISFTFTTGVSLGNLSLFSWWQYILIACFLLLVSILGGFVGAAFQHVFFTEKPQDEQQWNGKKRGLKQYLPQQ